MRRSTVLSLSPQLVFPGSTFVDASRKTISHPFRELDGDVEDLKVKETSCNNISDIIGCTPIASTL